jgi:hypothetical protein
MKSYTNYIKSNIEHIALYRKKYRNYLEVINGVIRNQYPITANLRNGKKITCNNYLELTNNIMNLDSDPEEDIVYADGFKFYGGKRDVSLVDIFVREVYKFLPVRDKVVIDIGASLADSSIYFACRGARKVVSLQPDDRLIEFAKKNVKANNLSEKIEIIHSACVGTNSNDHDILRTTQFMTLEHIINKLEQSPEILKVAGLAGREYAILLTTPEGILAKFSHIEVEYSFGYRNLKQKLETCGFHVTSSGPIYTKYPFQCPRIFRSHMHKDKVNNMFIGFIYAKRI